MLDNFPVQPHHFLPRHSSFWRKWTSCVAVVAQNTSGCDCRLVLYQFKFNISLLSRFMKPRMGIIGGYLLHSHNFLSDKRPY